MTALQAASGLTESEIQSFEQNGYLGPYALCTPDEMAVQRARIESEVLATKPSHTSSNGQSRHLDRRVVWDLCSHPAIVERAAAILGPDVVLWRSNFFIKMPGDKEIPWHQDWNYWPLEPAINLSAWLAIDEATPENSCVQLIPGSHKKEIPHVKSTAEMSFHEMADPACVDTSRSIDMPLKPGEFFLFNEKTLHHSHPNRSNKRRLGLAVRMTVPSVKVDHDQLFKGHKVILMRGEDRCHLNRNTQPPNQ